jgi:eukaryotic translation initiation factor 2C
MLVIEGYGDVKLAGDRLGLMTQCLKWKNVERPPNGYHASVMLKINTKLGGTNHTLVSRIPRAGAAPPATFQDPPASLSWVFDKRCMLVGIDVSHPDPGSDKESLAAVVGSYNGQASQYVAIMSAQPSRQEMVSALEDAMKK